MVSDSAIAKQLLDELFDISSRLDASVAKVQELCPESELIVYRRGVGEVMGEMWDRLLNPLMVKHPSLRPPQLKDADA